MAREQQRPITSRRASASPAERGAEFAAHQQRLKEEAAERRERAGEAPPRPAKPRRKSK